MVTLGIGLLLYEAANQAAFDHRRRRRPVRAWRCGSCSACSRSTSTARPRTSTASWCSCSCSSRCGAWSRSPFGLSLRGIRENERRMPAIGAPVQRRLRRRRTRRRGDRRRRRRAAGADHAVRRHRLARLQPLGRAPDHAGAGRHRPPLRRDSSARRCSWSRRTTSSGINPVYWQFWLGLLLVLFVLFARGGILGASSAARHA